MVLSVLLIVSGLHDQNAATSGIGLTMHPALGVLVAFAGVAAGVAGSVVLRRSPELVAPATAE
jgi:C4-dicarboxylate transporter